MARSVPAEQRGQAAGDVSAAVSRLEAFREALADDFNTPRAMAEVFELVGEANRGEVGGRARGGARDARAASGSARWRTPEEEAGEEAEALLAEREEARAARDFERADAIRDELAEMGWEVRDSADGARLVAEGLDGDARSSTAASRSPRRSGGGVGCIGSGGLRRRRREELERLCGSPDHQGVVAEVDPYPYADSERAVARPEPP